MEAKAFAVLWARSAGAYMRRGMGAPVPKGRFSQFLKLSSRSLHRVHAGPDVRHYISLFVDAAGLPFAKMAWHLGHPVGIPSSCSWQLLLAVRVCVHSL